MRLGQVSGRANLDLAEDEAAGVDRALLGRGNVDVEACLCLALPAESPLISLAVASEYL
jgi:hypothetical protein